MAYDLTVLDNEAEYRALFESEYCTAMSPILTHDDIWVRFYPDMFDHAFYESASRFKADKSVFSFERASKMRWIKEALQDPAAILKIGWDKKSKQYDNSKRVAVVVDNYAVIISMITLEKARFITAYTANNSIEKILSGPDWV